ncbi:MAG: MBL fold metallo-hydrolase [Candidatus Symbiothrix sp.]|jgi:hypothetical protein|nr:MBL fold metallo-hydrolase [Candidatus Symbiothrix sp.]
MIKLRYYFLFLLAILFCTACSSPEDNPDPSPPTQTSEAQKTMQQLWETSPITMSIARQSAFVKIQDYADICPAEYFKKYLSSLDQSCESMEKNDPALTCYRSAFDRVLEGIKKEQVEEGTVVIWLLYNMGYVVKTPSGCFGVDIYHRWAKKLEPYLDFLCVTHNHQDHYNTALMQAMFDANKPVLSNYFRKNTGYAYVATKDANYTIGNFSIRTSITDHNNTTEGKNFVTVFRIDCGNNTGNFTLLHVGDSNYKPEQYTNVQGTVDVSIFRYAPNALTENNILGTAQGQIQPGYVLLSHILELSHEDVAGSRWPIDMALERASKINCEKTYVPFWGEKLVWKNGKLN